MTPTTVALIIALSAQTIAAETRQLDVRTPAGAILIPADQIIDYRWPAHVLSLKPRIRVGLLDKYGKNLISGQDFVIAVDGAAIYQGKFKSVASSISNDAVTIALDKQAFNGQPGATPLGEDQVQIDLGYPTPKFFTGKDPRNDNRILQALAAAKKLTLKAPPTELHLTTDSGFRKLAGAEADAYVAANAFMEARWKEIEKLGPGSTHAELTATFRHDGGLSEVDKHRYVLILCPIIKINVTFENNPATSIPADAKIATVSAPHFEREFSD